MVGPLGLPTIKCAQAPDTAHLPDVPQGGPGWPANEGQMTNLTDGQSVNFIGFDYSLVDRDLAKVLKSQAARIKTEIGHQTQSILATGALLIEVKSNLQHGLFSRWVDKEIGVSVRTAENYMRAASLASECKSETISRLSPSTIYLLATMPEDAKSKNLQTLQATSQFDVKAFEAQIRSACGKKNGRKSAGNGDDQITACKEIAILLEKLLSEDGYRRFCELITGPSVVNHPSSLPAALQTVFGANRELIELEPRSR